MLGLITILFFATTLGQTSFSVFCDTPTCSGAPTISNITVPTLETCTNSSDPCSPGVFVFEKWSIDASKTHYTQKIYSNESCIGTELIINEYSCDECTTLTLPTNISVSLTCPTTASPTFNPTRAPTADVLLTIGVCQPWAGFPTQCDFVLNGKQGLSTIWINQLSPQPFMVQQMYIVNPGENGSMMDPVLAMPLPCSTMYLRLFCPTMFPLCSVAVDPFGNGANYSVYNPPDKSLCFEVNDACGDFFTLNKVPPIDCNRLNPFYLTELWPANNTFSIGGVDIQNAFWPKEDLNTPEWECPEPLKWVAPDRDSLTGSPCAMDCMTFSSAFLPSFSVYESGWLAFMILSWLSWFGAFYVFITHITFPDLWKFPHRLIIPMSFGALCMYTPMLGNSMVGLSNNNSFLCDSYLNVSRNNALANWSAWSLQFGAWIVANYWLTQSLALFVVVVLKKNPADYQKYEIIFHIWAWVMAAAFSFVPLGMNILGSNLIVPFPYFSLLAPKWTPWVFWFIFLILYIVQEIVTSGSSLIFMIYYGGISEYMTKMDQAKLLIFALVFFVTTIGGLSMQLWEYFENLQPQVEAWIKCLLLPGPEGALPTNCTPPQAPVGIYWWTLITFGMVGLYVFVIFGLLSPRVRTAWITGFKNLRKGVSFTQPEDDEYGYERIDDETSSEVTSLKKSGVQAHF